MTARNVKQNRLRGNKLTFIEKEALKDGFFEELIYKVFGQAVNDYVAVHNCYDQLESAVVKLSQATTSHKNLYNYKLVLNGYLQNYHTAKYFLFSDKENPFKKALNCNFEADYISSQVRKANIKRGAECTKQTMSNINKALKLLSVTKIAKNKRVVK